MKELMLRIEEILQETSVSLHGLFPDLQITKQAAAFRNTMKRSCLSACCISDIAIRV